MKELSFLGWALLLCAAPAFAKVTVSSPSTGSEVVSPFRLIATASKCASQSITRMGYSIDNSSNTTIFFASSIDTQVVSIPGAHTVHVMSWGNGGAECATSVAIVVVPDPATLVPSDAIVFKQIQALSGWQGVTDSGTTSGTITIAASPSLSGSSREFATTFMNNGDERYWVVFGANTTVSNFLYDAWVYVEGSPKGIANIEMDMNQVMGNGQTVIYGFQCDGWSGTWDYTANEGTPQAPSDQWLHTAFPCNPRNWTANTWHHVQITYSRDEYGTVTYQSVWFDGVEHDVNATVGSAFALGWGSVLLTNFQIDGYGTSGSSTVYLDNLTVSTW